MPASRSPESSPVGCCSAVALVLLLAGGFWVASWEDKDGTNSSSLSSIAAFDSANLLGEASNWTSRNVLGQLNGILGIQSSRPRAPEDLDAEASPGRSQFASVFGEDWGAELAGGEGGGGIGGSTGSSGRRKRKRRGRQVPAGEGAEEPELAAADEGDENVFVSGDATSASNSFFLGTDEDRAAEVLKNLTRRRYSQGFNSKAGMQAGLIPAFWLKNPRPVAPPLSKPQGKAKCPALFRRGQDGACRTPNPGLQKWCLTPLQTVNGPNYVRLPVQKQQLKRKPELYKTFTAATGPQPIFEAFIKPKDIPRNLPFSHFLLHPGNKWAMKIANPRKDFVAPKDLPALFDFTTCAVVGSSAAMLKSELGREIDAHSFVLRFNQAPTSGFEKRVGSKTSLRLQNQERTGRVPGDKGRTPCLVKGYNFHHDGSCRMLSLSPQFMMYTKFYWYFNRPAQGLSNVDYALSKIKMSTGMIGVTLALHLCGKVDVYGISGSRGHYYKKTAAQRSDATAFAERHPWQVEKACVNHLAAKLPDVHVRI